MSNHAAQYCKTLRKVTKAELINALHQSLMQFNALRVYETIKTVDNEPARQEIRRLLGKAGHPGFPS